MRPSICGRVGDAAFSKALRSLQATGKRQTLIVVGAEAERLLHFSASDVRLLLSASLEAEVRADPELSRLLPEGTGDAAAPEGADRGDGRRAAGGLEAVSDSLAQAATRLVAKELAAAAADRGALFELREGGLLPGVVPAAGLLILPCPAATLLRSWAPETSEAGAPGAQAPPFASADRMRRIEALAGAPRGPLSRHLVLRELAEEWRGAGSPSRASQCLRAAARSYLEWDDGERALEALRAAVALCPFDLSTAEDAILLLQQNGRIGEGEEVAETVLVELEKLKQHEPAARIHGLLAGVPKSPIVRRIGGEGLIRTGNVPEGLAELVAAGRMMAARKDAKGAARVFERVLSLDPSSADARRHLDRLRARHKMRRGILRWGSLVAGIALIAGWLGWDAMAASAFGRVRTVEGERSPEEAVAAIRREEGRFPLTRQPERFRTFEEEVYRRAVLADWSVLARACEARRSWDLDQAVALFSSLERGTVIPLFRDRARIGREEAEGGRSRVESLLEKANGLQKSGRLEEASRAYREILRDARREVFASGWLVPTLIDSAPRGAAIRVGRETVGTTPRWLLLPADVDTLLEVSAPAYQPHLVVDPLATVLAEDSHRYWCALELPVAWRSCAGGGLCAEGRGEGSDVLPVLGADGVLRGIDTRLLRLLWEAPIEIGPSFETPRIVGPAVLADTGRSRVAAYSLASGRPAWTEVGAPGSTLRLGPTYRDCVVILRSDGARILNTLTGLPVRDLDLGGAEPLGPAVCTGDVGMFLVRGGRVVAADLRTGARHPLEWPDVPETSRLATARDRAVVLVPGGKVFALDPATARPVWESAPGPAWGYLSAAGDRVCLARRDGTVACLRADDGSPAWSTGVEGEVTALWCDEPPARFAYVLLQRAGTSRLALLSLADGAVSYETSLGSTAIGSARTLGGLLIVSGPSAGTFALKLPAGR